MGFMVCNAGKHGKKPKVIHPTMGEAITEATRISATTENTLLILEVAGGVKMVDGKVEFYGPDKFK